MTTANNTTNHSKSDDEIFAREEKCNINNNDQNIITNKATYQKLPSVYLPMSLQNDASTFEP
jgi:hypothetical protein